MSDRQNVAQAAQAGERDPDERLADIKRRAAQAVSGTAAAAGDLSEDDLLAQAARGMAERRAARGDLVGAMTWEEIAASQPGPSEVGSRALEGRWSPDGEPGHAVPARRDPAG